MTVKLHRRHEDRAVAGQDKGPDARPDLDDSSRDATYVPFIPRQQPRRPYLELTSCQYRECASVRVRVCAHRVVDRTRRRPPGRSLRRPPFACRCR